MHNEPLWTILTFHNLTDKPCSFDLKDMMQAYLSLEMTLFKVRKDPVTTEYPLLNTP